MIPDFPGVLHRIVLFGKPEVCTVHRHARLALKL